jgi:hypothetical protein
MHRRTFLTAGASAPVSLLVGGNANLPQDNTIPFWLRNGFTQNIKSLHTGKFERLSRSISPQQFRNIISGNFFENTECVDYLRTHRLDDIYYTYKTLSDFPQNAPALEFLSANSLEFAYGGQDTPLDEIEEVIEARKLREIIEPLCNQDTTFADLTRSYRNTFRQMLIRFSNDPSEFFDTERMCHPQYEMERFFNCDESLHLDDSEGIAKLLKQAKESVREKHDTISEAIRQRTLEKNRGFAAEARRQEAAEKIAREKAAEEKNTELKNNVDVRNDFTAYVSKGLQNGEYIVEGYRRREILTHTDWHYLMLSTDPEAKPNDLSLSSSKAELTVHNLKLREFLDEAIRRSSKKGEGKIMVPNRRSSVDLNQLCPFQ